MVAVFTLFGLIALIPGMSLQMPWRSLHCARVLPLAPFRSRSCTELMSQQDVMWAWLSQQHVVAPETAVAPSKVCFVAVTANVLALDSTDDSQQILHSSRAARLDLQWHQQQVAVVGLQESRRAAGRGQLDHYVTFASGADFSGQCPHHGCELWLHKSLPWTTLDEVGPVTFSDMHATVALSDPCRLVVNLQHHEMKISFFVLHAPCRSASPDGSLDAIQTW